MADIEKDLLCPICGHKEDCTFHPREMVHGTRESFLYARCGGCGIIWLVDAPEDLTPYYQNYYSTATFEEQENTTWKRRLKGVALRVLLSHPIGAVLRAALAHPKGAILRALLERRGMPALVSGRHLRLSLEVQAMLGSGIRRRSRILDVGSGEGRLVFLLSELGLRHVVGCDPFIERDKKFRNGGSVFKRDIAEIQGKFDVVMLHHAFEHVPNPKEVAEHIDRLLRNGGLCILRFPNVRSVELKKWGDNWWCFHAPRHFFLYSRRSLELIFAPTALRIERSFCDSMPDHYIYSSEYQADIPDNSPQSFRAHHGRDWPQTDFDELKRKALAANASGEGDWIVYWLRKNKHAV